MDSNHKLGLLVAYYLSRFDKEAYKNLEYGSQFETHRIIGELLAVNPHTIKNWRYEFDPLHGHRVGWYQRPMNRSRIAVVQALQHLNETEIREVVTDILSGRINNYEEAKETILSVITVDDEKKEDENFILRADR